MNNHKNILKLEMGKNYKFEFTSREPEKISTPFGTRYLYPILYNGEEMKIKATERLKSKIDFHFKLRETNKVELDVFNGGNYNQTITEYLITPLNK